MPDSPTPAQRPHKRLGRAGRVFAILGISVLVLVVGGVLLLHTPPARRVVVGQVTELLRQQNVDFALDNLDYNLLELTLTLRNLSVTSSDAPSLPPIARIERLTADLSLRALLRGRYVLESGSAEGVDIHYVVAEDGSDNVPRAPSDPDQPSEPLDYLIDRLQVSGARVRYENRPQRIDVSIPVTSLEVDGNPATDRHLIALTTGQGALAVQDRRITLDRLQAEVNLGDDDVEGIDLRAAAAGSELRLSGSISDFEDPRGTLALAGTIDLARALNAANVDEDVSGTAAVDARLEGPLSAPAITASINGERLRIRSLDDIALAVNGRYDMGAQRATVESLTVRAPFGDVRGSGVVALEAAGRSRLQLRIQDLALGSVMRAFQTPYVVASAIDADVDVAWPGLEYLRASGDVSAVLAPTQAGATASTVPVRGRLTATARDGNIDAVVDALTAAGAVIEGRVRVQNQRELGGQLRVRVDNIAATAAAAERILARPALVPMRVDGRAAATIDLGGRIDAPMIGAQLAAPTLELGTARDLTLATSVRYTPEAVDVRDLTLQWQEATARASGTIGLSGAQPLQFTFTADNLSIAELLRAAEQGDVPASGLVSLQGRASGTAAAPVVDATLSADGITAYQEVWGDLTARVDLKGRQLTMTELRLDKPQSGGDGQLRGRGTYHLDRGTYTLDLASDNLQLTALQLPDGRTLSGPLQLTARGQGSIASPAVELDVDAGALTLDQHALGRISLDASVANGQATVNAAAPAFATSIKALIALDAPYRTTASVQVAGLDLATLPVDLTTPLEGTLTATVEAAGPLQTLRAMQATATIASFEGRWNTQPFRVVAPAVVRYADERLGIDRLELQAQDSTVALAGDLPLTREGAPGRLRVDAQANLATLARYAPADANVTADGRLTLTGVIEGSLQAIDPTLTLTLDNAGVATPDLTPGVTNLTATARVAKGEVVLERLSGEWGVARLSAEGRAPLDLLPELPVDVPRPGGDSTLTASVTGLELAQVPGAPPDLGGRVSVTADLSASRADLAAVNGRISFPELALTFDSLSLAQQQTSVVTLGDGLATIAQFALSGSVGEISARGTVGLTGERALGVDVSGQLNVAAVSAITDAVRAEGDSTIQIAARGTIAEPELNGFVELSKATFVTDDPTIAAENVNARLDLEGRRIEVTRLDGSVNGGTLGGSGFVTLGDGGIADASLELTTTDVALDFPLDLRSLSDATLRIFTKDEEIMVEGKFLIDEAGLTGDVNFDEGLLAAMAARPQLDLTEERSPLLERVRFNINVQTLSPIFVDNNLARAEVTTDLRVLGTPYEPGLAGRLTVVEGGEIVLNERRYEVDRGVITFVGERRITPSFDLRLTTAARNYDITLAVTGTPGDTETSFTSSPALPEPDILALLVTGRTVEEMRGAEFEVAREQVLSYLAGRVGSQLGRGLQRATGLSTVRIEPNLIANEADPGARLTVGQDITDDLSLVYSTNLTDSNDQIWITEYDITRRFQTRAVRQSDNSYRFDFRHDLRFGGQPSPRRIPRQRPTIAGIEIVTDDGMAEREVRQLFDLEVGKTFDFFGARNAVEEIRHTLAARGFLQARVRMDREGDNQQVRLTVRVDSGPRVDLVWTGMTPPDDVIDDVRTKWQRGVFDTQRIDDSVDTLRGWLMDSDYLQPTVTASIDDLGDDARRVRFAIEPGVEYKEVRLAFEGAGGVSPDVLKDVIEQQDLERALFNDPIQVTELLERYYREQAYLSAEIDEPRLEFEGQIARVILPVREGPRFTIREVAVSGNAVIPTPAILPRLPLQPGDPFLLFAGENALDEIRTLYWERGYNNVRSDYELTLDRDAGRVDVRFTIAEGRQSIIAGLTITGNQSTSERLVREQVELTPGEPLDLSVLARSRRNLYDTGAFSIVDITREPREPDNGTLPVQINVAVREVQPLQLRYGASFDTERGIGGLVDLANSNTLGKARVVGMTARYDGQVRETRAYVSQPSLRYFPVETTASVYWREDRTPLIERSGRFDVSRRGVSLQQELQLRDSYVWNYGFRYERANTFDATVGRVLDERITVTPLTSTLTRETRDDVLDATEGSLFSQALSYSPSWLGSDQAFMKYFGQYFTYVALEPTRRERFTNEIIRPRLVYAFGARLGLSRGFGGLVPISERFFAGGSTSLRGLEQNAAGPISSEGVPQGGEAMLVINNELRFPLISIFDGVGFADVGSVFPRIGDFSFSDLRETVGVGLRARTPWFLLRGDYGVLLDPRNGERRSRFYFSIGQAF